MKHDELQQILQNRFKGCPDAIIKRLMSISEAGLLDRDFASLPEDEKTLRYEKVYCPTEEEYNEINSMITELDASQKRLQVDYLRVSIILQDVECTAQNFDTAVRNGDFVEGLRELRVGLLAYYLIDDARKSFGFYGKDDEEIRELGRQLSPRTTFLAHMRNYISGHLDAVVLEKACQWGGFCIFTKDTMQDLDMSLFLINKYVLESAINCCIASKGDDKKEIGVDEITPLLCRFSERKNLRNDRLEKIILSAAKQSLTPYLPKLNPLTDFATLMETYGNEAKGERREAREMDKFIAHCYKDEKRELKDALTKGRDVLILIGPEGDFSEQEVEMAIREGFVPVGLGRSRLRTETAGVVACHTAVLLNED